MKEMLCVSFAVAKDQRAILLQFITLYQGVSTALIPQKIVFYCVLIVTENAMKRVGTQTVKPVVRGEKKKDIDEDRVARGFVTHISLEYKHPP